ncbi:MAG: leucine-rich repeat protein, partial [Roseburia sp.]|nr:leucine-rich repeat protein [Roseburia sp.]MCM1279767.1 leucine-rich repeat protein [Robinsoniella sp.]
SGEWMRELEGRQYGGIIDIAGGNGKVIMTTSTGIIIGEDVESPESRLSYLNIKQGNLDCEFQPDKTSYKAVVSESLDSIDLSARAMEDQASITIKQPNQMEKKLANGGSISLGLEEGDTVFEITVLAEDGMAEKTYYLTVVRAPLYRVSIKKTVGGYAAGAAYVEEGGSVVLTAVPEEGFQFTCWKEGDAEIASDRELMLDDIQSDREIQPVFEPVPDQKISFEQKEISAARGEEIILKLTKKEEEEGYCEYKWRILNGSGSSVKGLWYEDGYQAQVIIGEREEEETLYVQCYDDEYEHSICTAVISVVKEVKTYQITAVSSDEQAGGVTGGGSMAEHENMLLTAKANPGYYFVEWQENGICCGKEESLILSGVTEDKSLTAVFERKKLEAVQIARKPSKLSYKAGELFDKAGMLVKAVYNDGSWKFIADYDYSPKTPLTADDGYVNIVYEDEGIKKQARVTVKVSGEGSDKEKEEEEDEEEENKKPEGDKEPEGENKQPEGDKEQEEENKQPEGGKEPEGENKKPEGDKEPEEENKQPEDGKEPEEENKQPEGNKEQEGENKQPEGDKEQEGENKQPEGNKEPEDENKQPDNEEKAEGNTTDNYTPDKKIPNNDTNKAQEGEKTETGAGSGAVVVGAAVQVGNYKYKITKINKNGSGQVHLTGIKKALVTVKVPGSIKVKGKTFKVTGIGDNAFKNQKRLRKIVIGENVQKIGTKAFYGCRKLTSITIQSKKLTEIGKKAFQGISKKAVVNVPKKKYKKYVKLLKGKGLKSTMKIKKR